MNTHYYAKGREAIKLHTVNIIEITNGDLQSIRSFADTPEGNKQAERLFKRLVKEFEAQTLTTKRDAVLSNPADMQNYLDDGIFEEDGYQVIISHST
jgi:hypothetical protein